MSNQEMIQKASYFEIINHWVMAVSFFILALTGFAFLFHLQGLSAVFGGFGSMGSVHKWSGVIFTASLFFTIFSYLPVSIVLTKDDFDWIFKGGGYLAKTLPFNDPPQDKLNAAQKMFYLMLLLLGITLTVTGFVIWLMPGAVSNIRLSHLLHNLSFDVLMALVALHIYFSVLANPGTLKIMIDGKVPLDWARKRYTKWVAKMGY